MNFTEATAIREGLQSFLELDIVMTSIRGDVGSAIMPRGDQG